MSRDLQYLTDTYLKALSSGATKTAIRKGKEIVKLIKENEIELSKLKLKCEHKRYVDSKPDWSDYLNDMSNKSKRNI